jgi:hypothetical protein
MTEDFINVYGNYAIKLLRLQNEMIQTAIAAGSEERGIPAARGGKWSAVQVSRLLEAARSPFDASAAVGHRTGGRKPYVASAVQAMLAA